VGLGISVVSSWGTVVGVLDDEVQSRRSVVGSVVLGCWTTSPLAGSARYRSPSWSTRRVVGVGDGVVSSCCGSVEWALCDVAVVVGRVCRRRRRVCRDSTGVEELLVGLVAW
jgi:hypothetical protein